MLNQLKKPTRRTILQTGGALLAGGVAAQLGTRALRAGGQGPSGSPKVLALIGDRYHNFDYIQVCLNKLFHDLAMPVDYITYERLQPAMLRSYQLFLCLRDGMIWPDGYLGPDAYVAYERYLEPDSDNDRRMGSRETSKFWMSEEQGQAIADFVAAGNAFYAMHNCSHISLTSKNYRNVMGGAYIGHPPQRPFKVLVTNKEHPITQGVNDFIVNDEQHYVDYDKDPNNIFLRSENIDELPYGEHGTKAIAGWAHEFGKGRVVFTAVGHNIPALWHPEYVKLQKNAIRWLLRQS
jgi:hypothetical protein